MEYRLYFFVPYNISDIQKGVQSVHAAIQYTIQYAQNKDFKDFFINDKTVIILNGGQTRFPRQDTEGQGSLNQIMDDLELNGIDFSFFCEPDLNHALSAICFLADERVWNKEKYPDWEEFNPMDSRYHCVNGPRSYNEWEESVGGDKNVFLRELLKDKRLA